MMALIEGWYPPTRDKYEVMLDFWRWYAIVPSLQWFTSWYGMGKTSKASIFNLPGRTAWLLMESPGVLTLLYHMRSLPAAAARQDVGVSVDRLPWQNKLLAGLFAAHYGYRAVAFPLLQPSMAPIHALVAALALGFQLVNGLLLGSWLAAYGPTTPGAWERQLGGGGGGGRLQFGLGLAVFFAGLAGNVYHDEELRAIRRRRPGRGGGMDRYYEIPTAGLFRWLLYPHYLLEWCEWLGFYMACGWGCRPARLFLLNEIAAMLPRAVNGRRWYVARFSEDRMRGRWAIVPGVL